MPLDEATRALIAENLPAIAAALTEGLPAPEGAATEAKQDALIALLPASLGSKAAAASLAVTASAEDIAREGIVTEAAPASDTASSGLNGRLQRIAQRLTSLIALLPASLGSKAAAASLAVTDSTEDIARIGIVTEAAPASDTASSGLNGRLQRIAQRLTSLEALLSRPSSVARLLSAGASTNATSVKGSAGNVWTISGKNASASDRYLKLYNKATAPTVGTDTPVWTFLLPASQSFVFDLMGFAFSTGIAYALTTGAADADTGALTAADVVALNLSYA